MTLGRRPPSTGRITCLRLQLPGMAGARDGQDRALSHCPHPRWTQGRGQRGRLPKTRVGRSERPQTWARLARPQLAYGFQNVLTLSLCPAQAAGTDWVTGCPRPASRCAGTPAPWQLVTPQRAAQIPALQPPSRAGLCLTLGSPTPASGPGPSSSSGRVTLPPLPTGWPRGGGTTQL